MVIRISKVARRTKGAKGCGPNYITGSGSFENAIINQLPTSRGHGSHATLFDCPASGLLPWRRQMASPPSRPPLNTAPAIGAPLTVQVAVAADTAAGVGVVETAEVGVAADAVDAVEEVISTSPF